MTISTSVRRAGPFTGTGQAADYPFAFKAFSPPDVQPYQSDANGNERRLQYSTDYSVTLNPDQETHPGGVVRLTTALPAGHKLTIISGMPIAQPTEFTNQGGFYPRTLNDSLDRLTIYVQQLEESVSRAITVRVNADEAPVIPPPVSGQFLHWNGQGEMANIDLATLMSDDETGENSKIATIAALKKVSQAVRDVKQAYESAIQSTTQEVDALENSVTELRQLIETTGGAVPPEFVRRLENAEQGAASAVQTAQSASEIAASAGATATAAKAAAEKALPKSGGALTGKLGIRYASAMAELPLDNANGAAAAYVLQRNRVSAASMEGRFQGDGSTLLALQATPAGSATTDRRTDVMRLTPEGIWTAAYGNLHDHFMLATAAVGAFRHTAYPGHYQGAHVWYDARTKLKIVMMDAGLGSGSENILRLPEKMTGEYTGWVWCGKKNHANVNGIYDTTPTNFKMYFHNSLYHKVLLIGRSDE